MTRHVFNPKTVSDDVAAGVTLGVESIPDAMASALLAGVNPIFGLYAVMLSTPVGAIFASSVFMSVQTTSAMSLVVASVPAVTAGDETAGALFMLAVLTGIMMVVLGLLKLGAMLRFVPNAVMVGFINAVAVLIILGQLGDFTGYDSPASNKVMQAVDTFFNLDRIDLQTLAVGIVTVLLILLLANSKISRFGLIVALGVASLMAPLFSWESVAQVTDIATIPDSLPRPTLPDFSMIFQLLVPALSLAFVGLIQGAGVSQNYVNPDGEFPDASGDFIGQGAANIVAGFFQGMPVGGSLSATSLVVNSGAKSRFANIFAGITIAITLLLFGGLVGQLAMPALAGLLIVIGFQTLKPDDVRMVWKTGPVQQAVMVLTFVAALVIPLQYAVLMGVGIAILLFVFRQSNKVTIKEWVFDRDGKRRDLPLEQDPPQVLPSERVTILAPFGSLFFAAAPVFEEQLPTVEEKTHHAAVILSLRTRSELGSTFLGVIQRYAKGLAEHDSRLLLAAVSQESRNQFKQVGLLDDIGRENVFLDTEIVGESIHEALDEATAWLESHLAENEAGLAPKSMAASEPADETEQNTSSD